MPSVCTMYLGRRHAPGHRQAVSTSLQAALCTGCLMRWVAGGAAQAVDASACCAHPG